MAWNNEPDGISLGAFIVLIILVICLIVAWAFGGPEMHCIMQDGIGCVPK